MNQKQNQENLRLHYKNEDLRVNSQRKIKGLKKQIENLKSNNSPTLKCSVLELVRAAQGVIENHGHTEKCEHHRLSPQGDSQCICYLDYLKYHLTNPDFDKPNLI